MIVKENLQYAVIGKFSYGWPNIQDLYKLTPKQYELKGDCNIGLLSNRHIIRRLCQSSIQISFLYHTTKLVISYEDI